MCNIFTRIAVLCLPLAFAGSLMGCLANPTPHPGSEEGASLNAPSLDESAAEEDAGYGAIDAVVVDTLDDAEDDMCPPADVSSTEDAMREDIGPCEGADRRDP